MSHHGDGDGGGTTGSERRIGAGFAAGRRRRRRRKVEETGVRIRKTNGAATKDRAPDRGYDGQNREHE